MTTHTLTPDEANAVRRAQAAGERDVWLVVEGTREPIKPPLRMSATQMLCPYCNGELVEVDNPFRREIRHRRGLVCAGAPLIAPLPWADLARECETCGGQGWLYMPEDHIACPDCRDGRTLVELFAPQGVKPIRLAVATVEVEPDPDDPRMYRVHLTLEDQ